MNRQETAEIRADLAPGGPRLSVSSRRSLIIALSDPKQAPVTAEVKRYGFSYVDDPDDDLEDEVWGPMENGAFVAHFEYERLKAERDAALKALADMLNLYDGRKYGQVDFPNVLAAAREVLAKGGKSGG